MKNKNLATIALLSLTATVFFSCNGKTEAPKEQTETEVTSNADLDLIGKKITITYPEMTATVTYESDSILHWKTTDLKGKVAEADEHFDYERLSENLHFLNWIEADGYTVSQIIDTKMGTVKSFLSFEDPKSTRGKRSSTTGEGTFVFEK